MFRVNSNVPPSYAYPSIIHPPVLVMPGSTKERGTRIPARVLPKYEFTVGRRWISQEGLDWWFSFFSSHMELYAQVDVTFYRPEEDDWVTGSALMWFPEFGRETISTCIFSNFSVRFTAVEI